MLKFLGWKVIKPWHFPLRSALNGYLYLLKRNFFIPVFVPLELRHSNFSISTSVRFLVILWEVFPDECFHEFQFLVHSDPLCTVVDVVVAPLCVSERIPRASSQRSFGIRLRFSRIRL